MSQSCELIRYLVMLNDSLREQFLERQANNLTPEQLLFHYDHYFEKYSSNYADHPTEALGNCL